MIPTVGTRSDEHRPVCLHSPEPGQPQCGKAATIHVLLDSPEYGVVGLSTCDGHASIARAAGTWIDEHPFAGVCGFPSTRWESGRCVIDDSGVEPQLTATTSGEATA